MVEFWAVVTLRETSLGPFCLYFEYNTAKVCQFEYLVGLSSKVIRKRGLFTVVVPSGGDRRVADILR
jgi:hypothetical protein